jgi:putative ABC transport system permease protein
VWPLIRLTFRRLSRDRRLALTIVLSLASSLGAGIVMFSVIDAVFLRSVSYRNPQDLVEIETVIPTADRPSRVIGVPGTERQIDLAARTDLFERLVRYQYSTAMDWTTGAGEQEVFVGRVSPGMCELVGVAPVLGRCLSEGDTIRGDVAVLGFEFWKRAFQGRNAAVDSTIVLDRRTYVVVGVAPPELRHAFGAALGGFENDVWLPIEPRWRPSSPPVVVDKDLVMRLRPELGLAAAQSQLDEVLRRLQESKPDVWPAGWQLIIRPLGFNRQGPPRTAVMSLGVAVGCLFLIGCVNASTLLLCRAIRRAAEVAVHVSLGASRFRIGFEYSLEAACVVGVGAGVGLLLASWAIRWIPAIVPWTVATRLFSATSPQVDARTIGFALLAITAAALICGGMTGRAVSRVPSTLLAGRGHAIGSSRKQGRAIKFLQAGQVALTVLLLSGFAVTSLQLVRLLYQDLGFDAESVAYVEVSLPASVPTEDRFAELTRTLVGIRGITGATIGPVPADGAVNIRVSSAAAPAARLLLSRYEVPADYFSIIGGSLRQGRVLDLQSDAFGDTAVVSETLAHRFWPDQGAIGQRMLAGAGNVWTVVGVVKDIVPSSAIGTDSPPYQAYVRSRAAATQRRSILIRCSTNPLEILPEVQRRILEIEPDTRFVRKGLVADLYATPRSSARLAATVCCMLAVVAVLTAALGLSGLLALVVDSSRSEIGLRVALGAAPRHVMGMTIAHAVGPVSAGAVLGLLGAYLALEPLEKVLYGTPPSFWMISIAVSTFLVALTLAAAWLPVRSAVSVSPVVLLRSARS